MAEQLRITKGSEHPEEFSIVAAQERIAELEAGKAQLLVALKEEHASSGHLRPGRFGVVDLTRFTAMGCKTCIAIVLEETA